VHMSGKPTLIAGYTQDITEIAGMTSELAALIRQKEELITKLSHDLRTPLTPLMVLLPMIRKGVVDQELLKMVDLCSRSASFMKNLVNKALLLVSLTARVKAEDLARISLALTVERAIAANANAMVQKQVACQNHIDPQIVVEAVPDQMHELFSNLISNAVRFSPENGIVNIRAEQQAGTVIVMVHDDGIGLSPDIQERIFDEFFKADAARHDLSTSGLGLSICKQIVRNHHGRIWAENLGPDKGTTIKFTINEQGAGSRYNASMPTNHHVSSDHKP
jgi:signal transduction histidine kinase